MYIIQSVIWGDTGEAHNLISNVRLIYITANNKLLYYSTLFGHRLWKCLSESTIRGYAAITFLHRYLAV